MTSTGLIGSDIVLAERYDVALLDLDGVVYLGPKAVDGVPEALRVARDRGMRLAFVTNNAARPPEVVAEHLTELGIAAEPAEVTTSAQAAAGYLAQRFPVGSRVLVVGTVGLVRALTERGLIPVDKDDAEVVAVVQGYSPDLSWSQLAEGAVAIGRGALWVATNLDPTVPSPRGRLPGNGSLVAALRLATGVEPVATGKPDPTMHRESVERSGAQRPIVVGDRLDTDVEGANAVGCPSLLVFSGVTTPAELLAAPERSRPSYLADNAGGLLHTHPQPTLSQGQVECGAWSAQRVEENGQVAVALGLRTRGGDIGLLDRSPAGRREAELDALRALCTATWLGTGGPVHYRGSDDGARQVLSALGL